MSAFTDVLLRSIDKGLGVLGDTVRPCVYFHLEGRYKLSRHDLAIKPEAFADALKAMFGAEPNILLKQIVKELYLSMGLEPTEHQNWKFSDYVADAKRIFKKCRQDGGTSEYLKVRGSQESHEGTPIG